MVNVCIHLDLFMVTNTTNMTKSNQKVLHIIMLFFNDMVIVLSKMEKQIRFSF